MDRLCEVIRQFAPLAGRILMALIFVVSALGKITAFDATSGEMAAKGMPMTNTLLVCAIAIELIGSALLIVGWQTRWAALALIVFMIPATLYFHDFWNSPATEVRSQRNHFMKNLSIVGALIFVVGVGAGPLSLDRKRRPPG